MLLWLCGEWVVSLPALRVVGEEDDLHAQGEQSVVKQLVLQHCLEEERKTKALMTHKYICLVLHADRQNGCWGPGVVQNLHSSSLRL